MAEPTISISISIINYRTAALTRACAESALADLAACQAQRPGVTGEILIVDNASGDGSDDAIAAWLDEHPGVPARLIRSPVNGGFAAGHNIGIAAAQTDFVLLLNSDAVLRPGCLAELLDMAAWAPKAGLIAPRLEDADGTRQTSTFRFMSPVSELIRGANSGPVTKALRRWDAPVEPPDPAQVHWASFACILLRRTMIDAIGPMDEGYFLYFEDVEYSLRAHRAGWTVALAPEARAVHHRGGSGPVKALAKERKRLPPYYYASRSRYFYQRGGWVGLLSANLAWLVGRGIAQGRRLFGKPVSQTAAHEARDLWINVRTPLGPRRAPGE